MPRFELIQSAYAQSATPSSGITDLLQGPLPMMVAIGFIFYFLMIRPQSQKAKELRNQLSQLRRGDSIVTSGGIIGTVARVVSDTEVTVDIAEGVRVRVVRSTITGLMSKSEAPAAGKGTTDNDDADADPVKGKTPRRRKDAAAASDGGAPS